MATTPQCREFANRFGRAWADQMVETYETAKAFMDEFDAIAAGNIEDTAELIEDGAQLDGRKRVSGQMLHFARVTAAATVTFMEGGGTPNRITKFRAMSVNGRSRF